MSKSWVCMCVIYRDLQSLQSLFESPTIPDQVFFLTSAAATQRIESLPMPFSRWLAWWRAHDCHKPATEPLVRPIVITAFASLCVLLSRFSR